MPVTKIDRDGRNEGPDGLQEPGRGKHSQNRRTGSKRTIALLAVLVVAIALIVVGIGSCVDFGSRQIEAAHEGKAQLPVSSSELGDESYEDVETQFKNAGFANVKAKGEGDLIAGLLHREGDVDKVSVGGSTTFSKGDWVDANEQVVIRYHSYPAKSEGSGESSGKGGKKQKDASGSSGKTKLDVAGLTFEVPARFKKNKENSDKESSYYYASTGASLVMLSSVDFGDGTFESEDDFRAQEESFADSFVEGTGFKKRKRGDVVETEVAGEPAFSCDFSGTVKQAGVKTKDRLVVFYNEDTGETGALCLIQSEKSKRDYSSDFDEIVASAKAS